MGNVTSNKLGRGRGTEASKGLRRQQKHQAQPLVAPSNAAYYGEHHQARVKANGNNRRQKHGGRQQLGASYHQNYLSNGRTSSRATGQLEQDYPNSHWPVDETGYHQLEVSRFTHSQSRSGPQAHHQRLNQNELIGASRRVSHHQSHRDFISPSASYELLSHTRSNSSSSTAAAGHLLATTDQYDRFGYSSHYPDYYSNHQHPLTSAYNQDDQDYVLDSSAFIPSHHISHMHITLPPSRCLDACCNISGPLASSNQNQHHQLHTSSRPRRMNSPTQFQQQQQQAASRRATGQRKIQNGANSTNNNPKSDNIAVANDSAGERGLALGETERSKRNLLGLLPAAIQSQELQAAAVLKYIDQCQDELAKYVYLRNVKDFNENLFYYALTRNVEKLMPLVYTPTVGLACQRFSEIYLRPRGMYVTAKDAGRVEQLVNNWPERDVRVIVMTDGERILGLGDLGANGMGISIGKLSLYTALAGIAPRNVLPVTIDVGTNNKAFLEDPFYIGLRQERVRGEAYDSLIAEFMEACVNRWGRSCLIQFEDFANSTAFGLLEKHRRNFCTFNDDIQGTASVSLSGLMTAARQVGKRLSDCSYLFYGAGEANLGTAQLLIMAMCEEGLKREEAKKRIWLVDSKGLVVTSRGDLSGHKRDFAQDAEHVKDLEAIIELVKPSAIVGASAQGGSFTESICKKMVQYNERPIIFALSNPTSKAECTAAQAYEWTQGRCVFASGSPFEPVQFGGRTYVTGQGNNAYIFPGVGLACVAAHTHVVPEEAFLVAARALSDQVTEADQQVGLVYPSLSKIREVTLKVATRVLEHLYAERLATYRPEPSDKQAFLRSIQYDPSY